MSRARQQPRPPASGGDLLWGPPAPRRRGPRPALSLERIVAAGTALADAEGLGAVSMEKVAAALGCSPMALYRHVPGKAELVASMVELGLGPPPPAPTGAAWRVRLLDWAQALVTAFRRHPWSLEATDRLRPMGPNELAWLERGLQAFDGTGLTPRERQAACLLVLAHVRTAARFSARPDGLSSGDWEDVTRQVLAPRAEAYPQLTRLLAAAPREGDADFGLTCFLEGLEARVASPRRRRRSRAPNESAQRAPRARLTLP